MVKNVNAIYSSEPVKKTDYDVKINEIKDEISSITDLVAIAALSTVKN